MTILWVAKSAWEPAIRREHALAGEAVLHGHDAWFLERPRDIRSLADSPGPWARGLAGRAEPWITASGVHVLPSSVLVPAHRDAPSEWLGTRSLARDLQRIVERIGPSAVVAQTPWQWPAVGALRGTRRILEVTDDWAALLPARRARVAELQRRAAAEADAVVLVAPGLADAFADGRTVVVPNGVDERLVARPPVPPPHAQRLVYVGTLSPRFDAPLLTAALGRLPGWRLDLHGQCQYPGRGEQPGDELLALLDAHPDRVTWHGVADRGRLADAIDAADVALVPTRIEHTTGQDSMKLYDYAARGRPIVMTHLPSPPPASAAGLRVGATADRLAAAIVEAAAESPDAAAARRAWAAHHGWGARWNAWSAAVLGEDSLRA